MNKEYVIIKVKNLGEMKLELYKEIAPKTVENFLYYVNEKYYDGVCFHRIIKNFMAQTGGYFINDFTLQECKRIKEPIYGEFTSNGFINELKHEKGVISMARTNDKNSATGQFFICTANAPHLNGEYAAFGKVIEGYEVVDLLNNVLTTNIGYGFANFPEEIIEIEYIKKI